MCVATCWELLRSRSVTQIDMVGLYHYYGASDYSNVRCVLLGIPLDPAGGCVPA